MVRNALRKSLIVFCTFGLAVGPWAQAIAIGQAVIPPESPLSDESVAKDRSAAMAGDASAMTRLGWRYVVRTRGEWSVLRTGSTTIRLTGVVQDDAVAVDWFRKAAAAGYPRAMAYVGFMYEMGKGVPRDDAEAARWYRRGADAGDKRSQTLLASMYLMGHGVPQDEAAALKWIKAASSRTQGTGGDLEPRATTTLALLTLDGRGVEKNIDDALYYFSMARDLVASYYLGVLYEAGAGGISKNLTLAKTYFQQVLVFKGRLDELGSGMFELGNGVSAQIERSTIAHVDAIDAQRQPRIQLSQKEAGFLFLLLLAAAAPGSGEPGQASKDAWEHLLWFGAK
jgi:TPR repeat protein